MPLAQQALAGLQSHDPYSRNLISSRLEQERQFEDMQRRAALEQENPNFTSGATSADIESQARSLDESPTFGVEPQRQLMNLGRAQQGAQLQGFSTPQEQAAYGRSQEERKLGMPLEQEQAQQRGALNVAEMQQYGARQAAQERNRAPSEVAMGRYYDAMANAASGQQPGGANIQSMNKSGLTFTKPQPAINPSMSNQIAEARRKAEGGLFGMGKGAAQTKLQSLLAGALANHPAPDEDKAIAQQLLSNPTSSSMPIADLVTRMQRKGTLRPDQIANIREILMIMRGEQ